MAPYKRPSIARRQFTAKAPLTGAIIDAVLHYADLQEDQGCGRTLLRISARKLSEAALKARLGPNLDRARGVSILWNDREGEILRIFDQPSRPIA
jgi:hypothetical protein